MYKSTFTVANSKVRPRLKEGKEDRKCRGRIKMAIIVDEAKFLVENKYYNSFRWVIDQVIERSWLSWLWGNSESAIPETPLPFIVVFLGTNSNVAHFLPTRADSSARYFTSSMTVPQPFTALAWDIKVPDPGFSYYNLKYSSIADMGWLARFGRPYWFTRWFTGLRQEPLSKRDVADQIITIAMNKLHQAESQKDFRDLFQILPTLLREMRTDQKEIHVLTCSAILGILAVIDLDFTSPKRTADLVASRLRWAVGCTKERTFLLTAYPSEPVLAEAASRLLFMKTVDSEPPDIILRTTLNVIADEVEKGGYDIGGDGELVARVLCNYPVYVDY